MILTDEDLKLIKLAAKAAGIEVRYQPITRRFLYQKELPYPEGFYLAYWNPLTDDGDALRLAVDLDMFVDIKNGFSGAQVIHKSFCSEEHKGDSYAATRRAIVRAAAAIGEGM